MPLTCVDNHPGYGPDESAPKAKPVMDAYVIGLTPMSPEMTDVGTFVMPAFARITKFAAVPRSTVAVLVVVGLRVGDGVGAGVGADVGGGVGGGVGNGVGSGVSSSVGSGVGLGVGAGVGGSVGDSVGSGKGIGEGDDVGVGVGDGIGAGVGDGVGTGVGVGVDVGAVVGDGVGGSVIVTWSRVHAVWARIRPLSEDPVLNAVLVVVRRIPSRCAPVSTVIDPDTAQKILKAWGLPPSVLSASSITLVSEAAMT